MCQSRAGLMCNMFKRPVRTYDIKESTVEGILNDEANPLNRISRLIPDGSKILDIGAGNGLLARVLGRIRSNMIIDGIEPEPYAAKIARRYYRNFYTGYAQDFSDVITRESYDFIILADVIEHIDDPLSFMQNLCAGIASKTKIVLSVPNVAFGAVRLALLKGDFNYVDSGILERTHLRFFTLKTIRELTIQLNMSMEKLYFLQRNMFNCEIIPVSVGLCCLSEVIKDDLAWTYQFLLVLTKEQMAVEEKSFGKREKYPLMRYLISRIR